MYRSQIHYHTLWRDHARAPGALRQLLRYRHHRTRYQGSHGGVFGVSEPDRYGRGLTQVVLAKATPAATYPLRNTLGHTVTTNLFTEVTTRISTAGLVADTYLLSVQPAGQAAVASRVAGE